MRSLGLVQAADGPRLVLRVESLRRKRRHVRQAELQRRHRREHNDVTAALPNPLPVGAEARPTMGPSAKPQCIVAAGGAGATHTMAKAAIGLQLSRKK